MTESRDSKEKVNYTKLLDILISSLHISILEFDVKKLTVTDIQTKYLIKSVVL